jgi:hypothetical protein
MDSNHQSLSRGSRLYCGRGSTGGQKNLAGYRWFESISLRRSVLANLTRSIRSPKILPTASGHGSDLAQFTAMVSSIARRVAVDALSVCRITHPGCLVGVWAERPFAIDMLPGVDCSHDKAGSGRVSGRSRSPRNGFVLRRVSVSCGGPERRQGSNTAQGHRPAGRCG